MSGPAQAAPRGLASPMVWPARGKITTYFGVVEPTAPRGHAGLDIAAPLDTPVLAAYPGKVVRSEMDENGYGNLVVIEHDNGFQTWYAHMQRRKVKKGDLVYGGERIGDMGSTGYSTGSHVHFEVRDEGVLRDPLNFLPDLASRPIHLG